MGDGVDKAFRFALYLPGPGFELGAVPGRSAGELAEFIVVDLQIVLPVTGVFQNLTKPFEHGRFNLIAVDHAAVSARPALAVRRALHARLSAMKAHRAHAPTADRAAKQPAKQARHAMHCGLDDAATLCPHGRPRLIADNAEVGRFSSLVLCRRIGARQSFASGRVFDHADFVPDDLSNVDFVLQDAVAALCAALDRRRVPAQAAGRRNAILIQTPSDVAHRAAFNVLFEDAADDCRLLFHNLKLPRLPGDGLIAVGPTARTPAVANNAFHGAHDVDLQVVDKIFAHQRAERAVKLADLAGRCVDRYPVIFKPLACGVVVRLIAENAIHVFDDEHVKSAPF